MQVGQATVATGIPEGWMVRKGSVIPPVTTVNEEGCPLCLGHPPSLQGLDIGAETIKVFSGVIARANTIVWNGWVGHWMLW